MCDLLPKNYNANRNDHIFFLNLYHDTSAPSLGTLWPQEEKNSESLFFVVFIYYIVFDVTKIKYYLEFLYFRLLNNKNVNLLISSTQYYKLVSSAPSRELRREFWKALIADCISCYNKTYTILYYICTIPTIASAIIKRGQANLKLISKLVGTRYCNKIRARTMLMTFFPHWLCDCAHAYHNVNK